ncbi:MAG: hypothetical protein ABSC19_08070 [Syntrophorhabdales bacterium]|jgi:hypothetical protein
MIANAYADSLLDWERFYLKHFGPTYDFASLAIPACPGDGWRLLIIADIPLGQLYAKCKELFECWCWTDSSFDGIVTSNERDIKNGPYAIWVRNNVEADEELKNLSATEIKEKGIATETLAERLVHELKFFAETGEHLDLKNVTLCAGSLDSFGVVPGVCWRYGAMTVLWAIPIYRSGSLRARQAVSSAEGGK